MKFLVRSFLLALLSNISIGFPCGPDGEPCGCRIYGYRRALLNHPVLAIPDKRRDYSFQSCFECVKAAGLDLRRHLIEPKAFTSTEESAVNVASFGFVFFDQDGALINERPFHFAPEKEQKGTNVENLFFFVSGRCQRKFESFDPYFWCALPESAPKISDLEILTKERDNLTKERDKLKSPLPTKEDLKNIMGMIVTQNYLNALERQRKTIDKAYAAFVEAQKNFRDSVLEALYEKGTQEPFFDYICKRVHTEEHRIDFNEICKTTAIKTLSLPCMCLQPLGLGSPPPKIFYPKQSDDPPQNREGDFTHSEQYALFEASKYLDSFLDRCIGRMESLMWKGRAVGSYPTKTRHPSDIPGMYNGMLASLIPCGCSGYATSMYING